MIEHWIKWCLVALLAHPLAGCASGQTQEQQAKPQQPQPQKIQLKAPGAEAQPGQRPQVVNKDLFNISVSPQQIRVNGTPVANLQALEALLASYPKPMITLAAHRCLSTAASAEVLMLAQKYTDIGIAFGSYGAEDDAECEPPKKAKKK